MRQSNAFERSVSKAPKDLSLSTEFFDLSNKFKRQSCVLYPFLELYPYSRASEAVTRRCSIKKVVPESLQNSQEYTCIRVSFSLLKKRRFCEIFKNSYFIEHLRTTAPEVLSEILMTFFSQMLSFIFGKAFREFFNVF